VRLPRYLPVLVILQLSGYAVATRPDSNAAAVFRSGWECTITHVGVNAISSAVFAVANHNIAIALSEAFLSVRIEAFLVPHPQGYDVVILSERPLSSAESAQVNHIVYQATDDARGDRPMYERKKGLTSR
jgi:hypothetical protein